MMGFWVVNSWYAVVISPASIMIEAKEKAIDWTGLDDSSVWLFDLNTSAFFLFEVSPENIE